MKIGRFDFDSEDVYICAELGINHNGDMGIARQLIDIAAECGCDAVKFQKRDPDIAVPEHQKNIPRETPWGLISYLEYKHKIEFSGEQIADLANHAVSRNIDWFVSCWDVPSTQEMLELVPVALKLASASLTDTPLIEAFVESELPIIWSSGMSTMDEVEQAYTLIATRPNILCHCHSSYPANPDELNLRCMDTLRKKFPRSIIGYSGHEVALRPAVVAAAIGARFIERHITLDRAMWGTDQAASIEPQGLQRLVRDIREIKAVMSDGVKRLLDSELPIRKKLRRVI